MPFYSTVSTTNKDREEEVKRLKRVGPGEVFTDSWTTLPNGFFAASLSHRDWQGRIIGYTTLICRPVNDGLAAVEEQDLGSFGKTPPKPQVGHSSKIRTFGHS